MHVSKLLILSPCLGMLLAGRWPLKADDASAGPVAGSAAEPIRIIATAKPNLKFHDGGLPPAVGVQNIQVMRASRTHPDAEGADGLGWTYNHAPMLCYWSGRFYLEYLTDPVGEHIPPGQTMLTDSPDGFRWARPRVAFPPFKPEGRDTMTVSHQRMGFYVAPNGRLLVLSFYGLPPRPNNGQGIGRAVREIQADGTFGPIYFIRYNRHAGYNETNTPYPFYKAAEDQDFVAACEALLANKLMTQQWWEEDRAQDGFFAISGRDKGFDAKALSFFHRKDGAVVGCWKKRWTALSFDEGQSWTEPVQLPTLVTGSAKTWGQRTDDGRYALAFDPDPSSRWPLVVVTGDDGITFDHMRVVHGEIPYPRYDGQYKSMGPQYVRGIAEGNGNPPGNDMWLTYSVNKEDIWVSKIPVPIRGAVNEPVDDNFDDRSPGQAVPDWNVYSPLWAPVSVVRSPGDASGNCLELRDQDLYDYAKAVRVFPASDQVTVRFKLWIDQLKQTTFDIEVLDHQGRRPIRLVVDRDGHLIAQNGTNQIEVAALAPKHWHEIELQANARSNEFSIQLDGEPGLKAAEFAEAAGEHRIERLCFRTGPYRNYDAHAADLLIDKSQLGDRLDGDTKQPLTSVCIDDVRITK